MVFVRMHFRASDRAVERGGEREKREEAMVAEELASGPPTGCRGQRRLRAAGILLCSFSFNLVPPFLTLGARKANIHRGVRQFKRRDVNPKELQNPKGSEEVAEVELQN